jgi:predicted amidohydrolase YtcJ
MVTRRNQISGKVYGPDQVIPLLEALETLTRNGAYLTFDEKIRKSLEAGKLADRAVLDTDPLHSPSRISSP